eukprot:CAMPEP_0181263846 /NCGR_PEP_ID=MMETSP1097-20121128/2814_1 /TAXON_ID=35684 /ORGANISM="Pseudopedinella elastica, Strain CCMP716" /LENGTH=46 /DNA_ID= /DNA_START= /DNA_END= /DNA_ORIENTATION=
MITQKGHLLGLPKAPAFREKAPTFAPKGRVPEYFLSAALRPPRSHP